MIGVEGPEFKYQQSGRKNSEYVYDEAIEAGTDHALVLARLVVGS